jgi:membrane-associated phospholipid phosphatase
VLAGTALVISQYVAKPLVARSYYGELTFPSGNVTAVSATAFAMWLALYPLFRKRAHNVALVIGAVWTLLMALAVVGALWHTPLDALGSILLSVGVVAGGAAVFEHVATRRGPCRRRANDGSAALVEVLSDP